MLPIKLYPSFIPRHNYKKVIDLPLISLARTDSESKLQTANPLESQIPQGLLLVPLKGAKS